MRRKSLATLIFTLEICRYLLKCVKKTMLNAVKLASFKEKINTVTV